MSVEMIPYHLTAREHYKGDLVMENRILFSTVQDAIEKLFIAENMELSMRYVENILRFLSKACNYEEEERKISPNLLIGRNLNDLLLKGVSNKYVLMISKGEEDGSDFERIVKPLLPFCINGWLLYIDINNSVVEYGILRSFSGPQGLAITEVLFIDGREEYDDNTALVSLEVISNFEVKIKGLRGSNLIIDFRLLPANVPDAEKNQAQMVQDLVAELEPSEKEVVSKVFMKLLRLTTQRVHGTICLVVRSEYKFPNKILSSGSWFEEPIDLARMALDTLGETRDIFLSEMYYGLSGLFLEMLNVDGITIIDTKGRIRGYNIFISRSEVTTTVTGGARKRAAYALLDSKDPDIMGVYFQSQDGNVFYKGCGNIE